MARDSSVDEKELGLVANDSRLRDSGVTTSSCDSMAGNSWQQLKEKEAGDVTEKKRTRSASASDNDVGDSVAAVRRGSADDIPIEINATTAHATGAEPGSTAPPFGAVLGPAETGCSGAAEAALEGGIEYKVYKRRWFGLVQLTLLNIIVSFDVSIFSCFLSVLSASRWQSSNAARQMASAWADNGTSKEST
jgi:hypothetical protein